MINNRKNWVKKETITKAIIFNRTRQSKIVSLLKESLFEVSQVVKMADKIDQHGNMIPSDVKEIITSAKTDEETDVFFVLLK